jgi:putative membrane protein
MAEISANPLARVSDRSFYVFAGLISVTALGIIAYILLLRGGTPQAGLDLRFLPAVNAVLNALAASLLTAGYVAIRSRRPQLHQYCMMAAFVASSLFLIGYLSYHAVHGDTRFTGVGPIRIFYFSVLVSHVILSMSIVPLALTSFFFAFRRSFTRHRRIARITLPIWLYVSVTGVVIYLMLRGSPPSVP